MIKPKRALNLACEGHSKMPYYRRRRYHYYRQSDPSKFEKAIEMRNNPTPAEEAMWDILRNEVYQNFPDHVFCRQSVKYGYILDFYCPTLRLGIEVDGSTHDGREDYDYRRDNALANHGIQIFRFRNHDVVNNQHLVASDLHRMLEQKTNHRGFIDTPEYETASGRSAQAPVTYGSFQTKRGCFIATAAYGTPMAQEINTLRRFRDLSMEPNPLGKHLVTLYYKTSPPLATVIARSKSMKAFVRLSLRPIIRFFESSEK
jgi:very-short-patch-repair endonuclease